MLKGNDKRRWKLKTRSWLKTRGLRRPQIVGGGAPGVLGRRRRRADPENSAAAARVKTRRRRRSAAWRLKYQIIHGIFENLKLQAFSYDMLTCCLRTPINT